MPGKPLQMVVLFLSAVVFSACGYLDEELLLEDEQFAQSLEMEMEGIGITGAGRGWGCGGHSRLSRRHVRPRRHSLATSFFDPMYIYGLGPGGAGQPGASARMSDEDLLETTDVEMVDESVVAGSIEQIYYETKHRRDEAILTHYAH